jgi:hypothetical protein
MAERIPLKAEKRVLRGEKQALREELLCRSLLRERRQVRRMHRHRLIS